MCAAENALVSGTTHILDRRRSFAGLLFPKLIFAKAGDVSVGEFPSQSIARCSPRLAGTRRNKSNTAIKFYIIRFQRDEGSTIYENEISPRNCPNIQNGLPFENDDCKFTSVIDTVFHSEIWPSRLMGEFAGEKWSKELLNTQAKRALNEQILGIDSERFHGH